MRLKFLNNDVDNPLKQEKLYVTFAMFKSTPLA